MLVVFMDGPWALFMMYRNAKMIYAMAYLIKIIRMLKFLKTIVLM
jgi:hypothetical protein